MKEILILSPEDLENNKPTKILDKKLRKLRSFDSGFKFNFDIVEYNTIHEAMKEIFANESCFMVLGRLTDYGNELYRTNTPAPRRKKKGRPTIEDRDGTEMVLDLDDHKLKGFDPLDPVPAIKKWLKKKKIKCDVTWQITSSQKLNDENARIRLYFECNKKLTLSHRKAWSQSPEIMADGCVYTCSQPIYTAPPIIEKGKDPIKQRTGFIKGKSRRIGLPDIPEEVQKKYNTFARGGEDYDYEDPKLPKDVLNGKVYRRYFMPMAFHYVNKLGVDRDAIFAIIATKASQISDREFNEENTFAYIDDAIEKWQGEQDEKFEDVVTASDVKAQVSIEDVPKFPKNLMEDWPKPWPMIWKNLKKIPRELTEELLVPTILSLNSFMLMSNFVSAMDRRPNMFFLNLTPSTGNKDVNSKNVIEDLDGIFRRKGNLKGGSPFANIINGESAITADSSFLQSFDEDENLFWVNTEATRIFHQLSSSGNSNVSALADKLIEVVDGRKISGKKKSGQGQSVGEIVDPNAQVLFYAQPETIERYITAETVDSGLFGRTMMSILPNLEFDSDDFSIFMHDGSQNKKVEEDFYNFYMSNEMLLKKGADKIVLAPTDKGLELLHEWSKDFLFPLMESDESLMKVLKRMGIAAEQLYTIILGVCRQYDIYSGKKPRKSINVSCMLPLLEYWAKTKVYAIRNFVNTSLDPMAEELYLIIRECLEGKHDKGMTVKDKRTLREENIVSIGYLNRILRNRTKLIRKLEANNEKRNAISYALRLIEMMTKHGILIQKERGSKKFVGIAK